MLISMTGYGQASIEEEGYKINVEIKSINHRFCEVNIRMPRQFLFLEDKLKKQVTKYVQRGKVDVFVTVEGEGSFHKTVVMDWNLLNDFYELHQKAQEKLALNHQFDIDKMLLHPEVVTILEKENKSETFARNIITTVDCAAVELLEMRTKEGTSLAIDLRAKIEKLTSLTTDIAVHAPKVVTYYEERLLKRVEEFLTGKLEVDESRIMTEVAIFADKASIDEELIRLKSHLEQFLLIVDENKGPVGRKLDFLVQEMNREANTIGSKSNDLHISRQVVELKAELEKIKEQVQNIE